MIAAPRGSVPRREPLHVLQSFRAPRPTTNPYLRLLETSLGDQGVRVSHFTWKRALLGRYDVLHWHWPEVALRGRGSLRTAARRALFAALLLRLRATRSGVVRTVHNPDPHEQGPLVERALLRACEAGTHVAVHLTHGTLTSRPVGSAPPSLVPHGHFKDWYVQRSDVCPVPGRLLHFGILRPYKGIESLLAAMAGTSCDTSLRIIGSCADTQLAAAVAAAEASDPRTTSSIRHFPDEDLVAEIAAAELVVLPYTALNSSGAALLALSLDRPVLLPRGSATEELAAETGPDWVLLYDGTLTATALQEALASVRREGRTAAPDLSRRGWDQAGRTHVEAYQRARVTARG